MVNKYFLWRRTTGQSTFEYTTLVTIVLAVLLVGGVYFKRGVQGRWRAASDDLGEQYDPRFMDSDVRHTLSATTQTKITTYPDNGEGFWTMRTDQSNVIDTKTGSSRLATP